MIAFDYGATLRLSDGSPALRELVKHFNEAGEPVCIVSAIGTDDREHWQKIITREIEHLTSQDGTPLRFEAIRFVYYPANPTPDDMVRAGDDKAREMKSLRATLIFDDSPHVCEGVRRSGLFAVNHRPEKP
jgi:hypothetical protein